MRFGSSVTSLLKENRIKLFKDIPVWIDYFKNNGYNFAFGARIHGNIIALLAGIPVCLYTDDMRVLEMAEFFDIPYITKLGKGFDLYDAYNMIDYSKFNFTFESKLNNFQRFFDKYGIPCKIGQGIEHLTK